MGILQKMFNFAYGHQVFDFQVYLRKRFLKYLMSVQKAFGRKFSVSKSPKLQTVSELLSESAHFLYQTNWMKYSYVRYRCGVYFFKFYLQRCLAIPETEGLRQIHFTPFCLYIKLIINPQS